MLKEAELELKQTDKLLKNLTTLYKITHKRTTSSRIKNNKQTNLVMELAQYIVMNTSPIKENSVLNAHAVISVLDKVDEETMNGKMKEWKIVLKVTSTQELVELFEKVRKIALRTNHRCRKTQIKAGSKTCFACGPIEESEGENIFHIKLL